jgi:hypothetical protein
MSFSEMLKGLQALATENNAKLGTAISNWEQKPTDYLIDMSDKGATFITTEFGKKLAYSGINDAGEQQTLYFGGDFKDEAKSYQIVLFIYKGERKDRTNCFKAVAL